MTIKELIEQLSHMPEDMPVRVTLAEPVVDININQGEMICLIGRNGVGKTTLLKSLIGLLTPRRGEIVFN